MILFNNQSLHLYFFDFKDTDFPKKQNIFFISLLVLFFFLTFVRMKKQEFLESLLRADFCSKRYFIY